MKYQPPQVSVNDLDVVQSPFFGGEFGVYLTTVAAIQVGLITFSAADAAVFTPNAAAALPDAGKDLQVTALTSIQSLPTDDQVAVQLNGSKAGGDSMTGLAVFAPPSWSRVSSPNWGRGISFDLVPSVPDAKFKAITALAGATGGHYGLKLGVYALPEMADYVLLGCTTEIDFNTKSRVAKGIDCRMEADAFVKRGKTQPGELKIGSKFFSMAEGMARFDGLKTTCMLVGVKDGQLMGDRLTFTEYTPTIKPRLPDGDGEAMHDAEGKFVEHLFFVAPGQ